MHRRSFLLSGAAAAVAAGERKKTVAAIVTEYRKLSHADVICSRILEGYSPDNIPVQPRTRIVSMYTDQVPANDLSRAAAAKHGFKIYPTIAEALTLGGDRLAVDAVLLVGEHGNYPTNEKGQKMYPRFELFQQIIEVFRRSGRVVPLFSDKHLSYSWEKAKKMYDETREMKIPFMAGSSIPVTVRVPELEIPLGAPLQDAVVVGYGDLDAYGFHTLEALQCMIERRAGAETGIAAVEWLEGDRVWRWRDSDQGRWSAPLLNAALSRAFKAKPGKPEDNVKDPVLFRLQYRDGFRAVAYMLNGQVQDWLFATRIQGKPEILSTHFGLRDGRYLVHFDGLVHCIEELFITGKPVYPVERTLLTTGALAFLFDSRMAKHTVETPQLRIAYQAPRHCYFQRA